MLKLSQLPNTRKKKVIRDVRSGISLYDAVRSAYGIYEKEEAVKQCYNLLTDKTFTQYYYGVSTNSRDSILSLCARGKEEFEVLFAKEGELVKNKEIKAMEVEAPKKPVEKEDVKEMTKEEMKELCDFHGIKYHHASGEAKLKNLLIEAGVVSI